MNSPYISAGGLCTGVGVGVEASCAAIRAGLSGLDECQWLDDAGRPIIGVALRGFERARLGDRLLAMLAGVIEEAATRWQQRFIPCCVVAWPSAAGRAVPSETELELELEARLGIEIGTLRIVLGDELASVRALSLAWQQLNAERLQACLVCGVDSWFDTVRLARLASQQRLRTLDESDGIAPGEAAASVWVTPRSRPLGRMHQQRARQRTWRTSALITSGGRPQWATHRRPHPLSQPDRVRALTRVPC